MKQIVFLSGRTPDLAFLELKSIASDLSLITLSPSSFETTIETERARELFLRLGGMIRVAEKVATVEKLTAEDIVQHIGAHHTAGRITFGISSTDSSYHISTDVLRKIKDLLHAQGLSSRFVQPVHDTMISSVVIQSQSVIEFIVIPTVHGLQLVRTIAVQDYAEWNKRDYDRPRSDPKAGMLPPKVARMAANIAIGATPEGKVVLDPFCGMGTVLAESCLLGCSVIGIDILQSAVEGAKQNIAWLGKEYGKPFNYRIEAGDATHVSTVLSPSSVDAIITEPFMGSTKYAHEVPSVDKVKDVIKGLERLYAGCLKDWWHVLKSDGVVFMALPEYTINKRQFFVKKIVDSCENFGYTILAGPIEYSRPQAVVKRLFYKFQRLPKQTNSRIIPAED